MILRINEAISPVYKPCLARLAAAALLAAALCGTAPVQAQAGDWTIVDAREALRKKDRNRLAALRAAASAAKHPLAMWADYWELNNRLGEAQQEEVSAFEARWRGTYVEDRLRNDWLLQLGKRRDWANFSAEFPNFRMNDDREVTCYALLVDHLDGKDVRDAALAAWLAQRDADDGCSLMAGTLVDAKVLTPGQVWRKARYAVEANRVRAAQQAASLISAEAGAAVGELGDGSVRYLARKASAVDRTAAELTTLALTRLASNDADAAAAALNDRWDRALPAELASWAWAMVARQSAQKLEAGAADLYQRAELRTSRSATDADWPDETLAWKVRAALRADTGRGRWQQVMQAINAMSPAEQRDPAWVYWKARGLQAIARDSQDGESLRQLSRELMVSIAGQLNFYGELAAENQGIPIPMPARPVPLTSAERESAAQHAGLRRALQLISIGLRNEGVREWNYSLRDMNDRELLAAAQLACDREVWDRCINTSDRTRDEIDMEQRFPMPFRKDVTARSREIGLDPAYVYGLIRQESRFIIDARSGAGASGLMQVMPATARWTAKKIGLPYTADLISDRDTNLRLGTGYLKLVLDDFAGSQALAAAAYNAGPGRPRRWRDGPPLEPAVWAENIPFPETRDYVKKVLSNGSYYAALLSGQAPSLKSRLGRSIGPADPNAPVADLP